MQKEEIIDVIKNSKKYSTSNFEYDIVGNISYTIGNCKYLFQFQSDGKRVGFLHVPIYRLGIEPISVNLLRYQATEAKVLSKFDELIRTIKKLDTFLSIRENDINKIQPIIENYIKKEYEIDSTDKIVITVKFPQTVYKIGKKYRKTSFNIKKEKIRNIIYDVSVTNIDTFFSISLFLIYNNDTGKLTLKNKYESYTPGKKDITKIIRSEKLKRLMSYEDESNNIGN